MPANFGRNGLYGAPRSRATYDGLRRHRVRVLGPLTRLPAHAVVVTVAVYTVRNTAPTAVNVCYVRVWAAAIVNIWDAWA